jgi:hypothetical protein
MSKKRKREMLNLVFQMPTYDGYVKPQGFLEHHPACHALFHYATLARKAYEESMDTIVLDGAGDLVKEVDYRQLFSSVATAYGVEPEVMVKFWPNVNLQFATLRLPMAPEFVRFSSVPEVGKKH